jgi:HAD superfamily hydrolase (TIGR01450 family)
MASLDAVKTPAICFDIDGVFKAGRFFFADGLKALATAKAKGCPVCFVTNGGGGLGESEYLAGLKKKIATAASEEDREARMQGGVSSLDLLNSISDNAMILSYTPMGEAEQFKEQKVLLVGDPREKVETVARSYGWNFVHVTSYCGANPTVDPFAAARGQSHTAVANEAAPRPASPARGDFAAAASSAASSESDNFDSVVVMTDPHDWFEALQATIDVVVSGAPNSSTVMEFDPNRRVQVHFSNPDIFWKAAHPQPRFGQGAFRLAFETLLRSRLNLLKAPPALIDMRLRECVVQWGKPSVPTLSCAERRLTNMCSEAPRSFWMVGDNPASDMALACMGDESWRGVLVKTGVYVDTDAQCGADAVVGGVLSAVEYIIEQHQGVQEGVWGASTRA